MKNSATAVAKTPATNGAEAPTFVEATKFIERMNDLTREINARAFDLFRMRNVSPYSKLDDWLRAESEFLQSTPVEITETKDSVKVRATVPGFKLDEIEMSIKDGDLFLAGDTHFESKSEDETTYYSEWRSNRFCRQLHLPAEVEAKASHTKLKDGILTLSFKKKRTAN